MKTIYKYELPGVDNKITLPVDAQVLHVAEQHNKLYLWAQVDPYAPADSPRRFIVVGTGNPIPYGNDPENPWNMVHVGSLLTPGGAYVFHVFEVTS